MERDQILKRIEDVMKTEATVPVKSDFFLTHVPFRNLSLGDTLPITEEELYEEKLLANPEQHKTIMILGENGSGKSHLIRWLYYKYIKEYGENHPVEKILWISKIHNTLQDALMQLLKSDIFPDEIRKNELEKVKNAQSTISGSDLKKTINFNFTLEIENDNTLKVKSKYIDTPTRTMLPFFLKNEYILEKYLMRDNGPLDRICSKLNNNDNQKTKEFEGEVFLETDFAITLDDLKNHIDGGKVTADSYTRALARKLHNSPAGKLRKSVADYMNSKVDEVIQRSLKLKTSDFKKLFSNLRVKLKEKGMRLTLFVEDINAFTGIDLALMDVLVANHESQGNEEYCRLASVVGTTTDFYKNRLNDSLRDRVKDVGAEVYIREESLFGDENRLTEFAARYINACMIPEKEIQIWESESGCDEESLPVAPVQYTFCREKCFGKEMSIFPFNRTAITNMYEKLDSLSKTPRRFILDVLYPILTLYYNSPEEFLDNESAFKNDSITSLKDFKNPNYVIINDNIDRVDAGKRSLLLRIWGDATTEVRNNTLGGLDKEVFDAFGINMLLDQFKIYMGKDASDIPIQEPDTSQKEPKLNADVGKSAGKSQTINKTTSKTSGKDKESGNETYDKIKKAIGDWSENPEIQLPYSQELRKLVSVFIYGNIEWDVEEIPRTLIEAYINTVKYINIEGQNAATRDDSLMIKRNQESRDLFYALIGYKYLGDNSWNFDSGLDYYNMAMTWLLKYRTEILKLVTAPFESQVSYQEVLIASLYCKKLFTGGIRPDQAIEDVLIDLFDCSKVYSNKHTEAWRRIYKEISGILQLDTDNYSDKVRNYFSNVIGTAATENREYIFVDSFKLISILKKMADSKWDLSKYTVVIEKKNKQDFWYKAPQVVGIVANNMHNLIASEIEEVRKYTAYFRKRIPSYRDTKQVEQTIDSVRRYLKYLMYNRNMGYEEKNIPMLSTTKSLSEASTFSKDLSLMDAILNTETTYETINMLALNPFDLVSDFYQEFRYIDRLIKEKNEKFKSGLDLSVNEQINKRRASIQVALSRMITVGQEVNK